MSNVMLNFVRKAIGRAMIGLISGLTVGSVIGAIEQIHFEVTTGATIVNLPLAALISGVVIGTPVGVITAVLSGITDYKSGWGIEWAIVGALAAALVIAGLDRPETRQLMLIVALMVTGATVERSTAILLKDKGQSKTLTPKTLAIYAAGIFSITVTLRLVFNFMTSVFD
jgi:hypothetical protein